MTITPDSFRVAARRSVALEEKIANSPEVFRVLSGDRPTGALHLGHFFATLANRVRLQDLGVEVNVVVADYQVITDRDSVGQLAENVRGLVADCRGARKFPRVDHRNSPVLPGAVRASRSVGQPRMITSSPRSSVTATGSSQWGHEPPMPTLRMKVPQSAHRCSPRARAPHASHS